MEHKNVPDVSVIIPVYNQADSLRIVLEFFKYQTYPHDRYEIIIVNDGSTEEGLSPVNENLWPQPRCRVRWVHQENKGRAAARNAGVAVAEGKYLIFCDADRFPCRDFVKMHMEAVTGHENTAVIGCPWDYFGNKNKLCHTDEISWPDIVKYSRKPQYYVKISNIFNEEGLTDSSIAWASFLVGNSCVNKSEFIEAGGFDPEFNFWGFEHFELGLRLQNKGIRLLNCPDIGNFHIPHARGQGYYRSMIEDSTRLIKKKHPGYDFQCLKDFMFGNISLQEFEYLFCGRVSGVLKNKEDIFYKTKL